MTIKLNAEKESISALLDDEIRDNDSHRDRLIDYLCDDEQAQQTWKRYHLIGDLMRPDHQVMPEWDIASKVALALEDEPAHSVSADALSTLTSSPLTLVSTKEPLDEDVESVAVESVESKGQNNVLPFAKKTPKFDSDAKQSTKKKSRWFGALGQLAVAASVCFIAVVGVNHLLTSPNSENLAAGHNQSLSGVPVLQTVPLAGVAEPVSLTAESLEAHRISNKEHLIRNYANAMFQDYELQLKLNAGEQTLTPSVGK